MIVRLSIELPRSTLEPIQGVDAENKLQIDVLDLAEKLQLLPKDEATVLCIERGRKR